MKKYRPLLFLLLSVPNINSSSKFPINELGTAVGSAIIFSGMTYLWCTQKIKQLELENAALKQEIEQLKETGREVQNIIYDMSDQIQAARPQPSAPSASDIQPENSIPVNQIYQEYPAPDFSKHQHDCNYSAAH